MGLEHDVEQRVINLPRAGLSLEQSQGLLLEVADIVGSKPVRLTGPDAEFLWRHGDRGLAIGMNRAWQRDAYQPTFAAFDWGERDAMDYRIFNVGGSSPDEVPYTWRIPLGPGDEPWLPAHPLARTWSEFFTLFTVLNTLPATLAAIPPAWRPTVPRDAIVNVAWNIDGPVVGSLNVDVCPGRLRLWGYGTEDLELEATVEDLEFRGFTVPALLAGLTATGSIGELQYVGLDGAAVMFPEGPGEDAAGLGESEDAEDAGRTLTLAQARALLAGPAKPEQSFAQRPVAPIAFPLAPGGVTDLSYRMLTQPDTAKSGAAAAGLDADAGRFYKSFREVPLEVAAQPVPHRALLWDPEAAWDYGTQVTQEMTRWLGAPHFVRGGAGEITRVWRAGEQGAVAVSVTGSGTTVIVGSWFTLMAIKFR